MIFEKSSITYYNIIIKKHDSDDNLTYQIKITYMTTMISKYSG